MRRPIDVYLSQVSSVPRWPSATGRTGLLTKPAAPAHSPFHEFVEDGVSARANQRFRLAGDQKSKPGRLMQKAGVLTKFEFEFASWGSRSSRNSGVCSVF